MHIQRSCMKRSMIRLFVKISYTRQEKWETCIVENLPLKPVIDQIEEIVIFRWNKVYPSDQVLDVDLEEWKLAEEEQIEGSTHEITKQIYLPK